MSIPDPTQTSKNQQFTAFGSQKKTDKKDSKEALVFANNPLFTGKTTEGHMPPMPIVTEVKTSQSSFSYAKAKTDLDARKKMVEKLEVGDIIVVRLQTSSSRDLMQKVNHWFHKLLRPFYERHTKIASEDTEASHIMLVTHVDKEKGELVISEAVLAGTRTIDYFTHDKFGVKDGSMHEFYRPTFSGNTQDINNVACIAMKRQTEAKKSVQSDEAKENTTEKAKDRFAYSKHKAVRSLFTSGYGHTSSRNRIVTKSLKQFHLYHKENPMQPDKKKTMFCSQMVSSNLQLGVFHAAVTNLRAKDPALADELEKFMDASSVPSRKDYRQFVKTYGKIVLDEMQTLCPQIKFSAGNMSPTVFSALLRNTSLGNHILDVKP